MFTDDKRNSGSYLIIFELPKSQEIQIGKLTTSLFEKGYYLYAGSGLRNLRQRVERHIRKNKALKWHIDYLSVKCKFVYKYIINDGKNHECFLSKRLSKIKGISQPVKGFGSSDCKCFSHLSYTKDEMNWSNLVESILA